MYPGVLPPFADLPCKCETLFRALRSYGDLGRDGQRNRGFFSGLFRGVSNPREGSKILAFVFQPRLIAANFALCVFSEVLHSPGPMRQGFLCRIGDWKLCVHTFSAKLASNSQ